MAQQWQTVKVFISSTFRDMQAERDHLVRFVFPRLRQELLARHVYLVDVDLRWGVLSDQDSLQACLDIIDECRPHFLCLLGKRYGWIPAGHDTSITAQEIQYGAFQSPEHKTHHFFYFRADSATDSIPMAPGDSYSEPVGSASETKLTELKRLIVDSGYAPRVYDCRWDENLQRLVDLEDFGKTVYNDLLSSINARLGGSEPLILDEFESEAAAVEIFQAELASNYQLGNRASEIDELRNRVASKDETLTCVTGEAGSGKSAFLAYFHRTLETDPIPGGHILHSHFVGASAASTNPIQLLRRLHHELAKSIAREWSIPDTFQELRESLAELLKEVAGRKKRVIILFDGLDQLMAAIPSQIVNWIPQPIAGVHFVFTCTPGTTLEGLRARCKQNLHEILLDPLSLDTANAIVNNYLGRYNKKFNEVPRRRLLEKTASRNPLYLAVALEELRTTGDYEGLAQNIADLPDDTTQLFEAIIRRLEHDPGFRDAAGNLVGKTLVRNFLTALACSRFGMTQQELEEIVPANGVPGNVATLQRLLRRYLVMRGPLLNFFHNQFKVAVQDFYLETPAKRKSVHRDLAGYFHPRADPGRQGNWQGGDTRALAELPYHLLQGSDMEKLQVLFSDVGFLSATCTTVDTYFKNDGTISYRGVNALLQHLGGAIRLLSTNPQTAHANRTVSLRALFNLLADRSQLLARHPETLPQEVTNYINVFPEADISSSLLSAAPDPYAGGLYLDNKADIHVHPGSHTGAITALAGSPGSPDRFASGGADGSICYWQINRAGYLWHHNAHKSWITAVAVSDSGRRVVSASHDGVVNIWDAELGTLTGTFSTQYTEEWWSPVQYIFFLDEDTLLLSHGINWVGIFDLRTEELNHLPELAALGADATDGAMQAAVYDYRRVENLMAVYRKEEKSILIASITDGSLVAKIPAKRHVRTIVFVGQGRKVFFTDAQGMFSLYDLATGRLVEKRLEAPLSRVCHSDSGFWAVDTQENLLHLELGQSLKISAWDVLQKISDPALSSALLFLPDSKSLIIGKRSGAIFQWNTETNAIHHRPAGGKLVKGTILASNHRAVGILTEREHAASDDYEGESLVLIDQIRGDKQPLAAPHQHFITGVAAVNDDSFATVDRAGTAVLWKDFRPAVVKRFAPIQFTNCAHRKDTNQVILATHNAQLIVWDGNSEEHLPFALSEHAPLGFTAGITAVDGNRHGFAATYLIELIRYSGKQHDWVLPRDGGGHSHRGNDISISPDGSRVADGNIVGEVRLWDTEHGKSLGQFRLHDGAVNALAFSQDGRYLCSAGSDRSLYVMDAQDLTVKFATMLPASILAIKVEQDESIFALDNTGNIFRFLLQERNPK